MTYPLILVCVGSALGGGMRFLVAQGMLRLLGSSFPWGTWIVNVTGSYLIGLAMYLALNSAGFSQNLRVFLTTGVMGGLTTFSTFNYETIELVRSGNLLLGGINLAGTVVLCLIAGILGLGTGRAWLGGAALQ